MQWYDITYNNVAKLQSVSIVTLMKKQWYSKLHIIEFLLEINTIGEYLIVLLENIQAVLLLLQILANSLVVTTVTQYILSTFTIYKIHWLYSTAKK